MRISRTQIAWLWTLLVFGACWTPRQMMPGGEGEAIIFPKSNLDKFIHFALFFGFAWCWIQTRSIRTRWVLAAGIAATAATEIGQLAPIINRDATWPDAAADLLGLVSGLMVFALVQAVWLNRAKAPSAETP